MTTRLAFAVVRAVVLGAVLACAGLALAQTPVKPGTMYGEEDRDWNVPPTKAYRTDDYHGPTPREIPGGRVVTTYELAQLMTREPRPYVIDVLGGGVHRTIAGAFWMVGAGAGDMSPQEQKRFLEAMGKFAAGNKNQPLVFFCVDSQCWLSYNAALRAIAAGYTNVMWYRGGVAAWRQADQLMAMSDPFSWKD